MKSASSRLAILTGLVTVCLLAGCFPPRDHATLPGVSNPMASWAKQHWNDATVAQLNHGRDTMISACTECHSMPAPSHESSRDWPEVMQRMAKKAKLGADEETAMLHYILAARDGTAGAK